MESFWLCFVPLFVAVDPIGILPLFMSLTGGVQGKALQSLVVKSVITAIVVSLGFVLGGNWLFAIIGVTVADFMIAGGVLLFVIAMTDLISFEKERRKADPDSLGAVPIGVPLMAGPAVFATGMLLLNEHGPFLTSAAIIVNMVLAGLAFRCSSLVIRLLGDSGARITSKVASLILAAFSIMLIRKGIMSFFG